MGRGEDKKPRKKRSKVTELKDTIKRIAANVGNKKKDDDSDEHDMPFASTLPRVKELGTHTFKGEIIINLKKLK